MNIYDSTISRSRLGGYAVGLIDHLDPIHDHVQYCADAESATWIVLSFLAEDYTPEQIVVLDGQGLRKKITVCNLDWDALENGAYASDFISFY